MPKNGGYRYMQYIEANLRDIVLDDMEEDKVKTKIAYDVGINMAKDIFVNDKFESKSIGRAKDWILTMIEFMLENNSVFSNMEEHMQNDESIYRHSINVTVIGLLFAKYTGLDISLMNKLGAGLLLHDIGLVNLGYSDISQEYAKKENDREAGVNQHPLVGAATLAETKKLTPEVLRAIREHHENIDGSGYPYNLRDQQISKFAKYIRVIDEYSLLTTREKEKKSKETHVDVLNKMVNQSKKKLDTNLLTHFGKFLKASYKKDNNRFDYGYQRFKYNRSIAV